MFLPLGCWKHAVGRMEFVRCHFLQGIRYLVHALLLSLCGFGWHPLTCPLGQTDVKEQLGVLMVLASLGLCCTLLSWMEGGQPFTSVSLVWEGIVESQEL